MRQGYYYLITSLPELNLTDKDPVFNVLRFREFIYDELTPHDKELFETLFYHFDIENLVTVIKSTNNRWHPYGNFSEDELKQITPPRHITGFHDAFVGHA